MKLIDICNLPTEEERNDAVNAMIKLLNEFSIDELVRRMKYIIFTFVALPKGFKQGILDSGNYNVHFIDGLINSIDLEYTYFDTLTANLDIVGFELQLKKKHGFTKNMLKIEDLEYFIKETNNI